MTGRRWPSPWKIGVLSTLYFAQGLPFGFQATALPLYLVELGLSKTKIGLLGALALPWSLKLLWAPLVDRYGSARFGRRKSWIVPMQALLAAACFVAALFPLSESTLTGFLVCVLLMNLFAATQDVAVDGLAVDLLEPSELGAGNAAQVVGYKLGMIVGGGLLVSLAARAGWGSLFFSMGALCLTAMTVVLFVREPAAKQQAGGEGGRMTVAELWARMKHLVRQPGVGWLLAAVATYKAGETLADAMFGIWLKEVHQIPKEQIAVWLGTWGVIASLAGSAVGGLLATRLRLKTAVAVAAVFRVIPLAGQWALVAGFALPTEQVIIPLTSAEHFFGGILTTTMFALMMSSVDRRIGATHFTLLASVEVIGKSVPRLLSGWFVDLSGYQPVFAAAVALSTLFLLVVVKVPRFHGETGSEGGSSAPA